MTETEKLKICLVGATGVGKTSLVTRYVRSVFQERYLTTIGVTIDRHDVRYDGRTTQLVIWDLSGEDEFQTVQLAYLRGAAGYVLVTDGTRPETIETARSLEARVRAAMGPMPFVVALNKADLAATWGLRSGDVERLQAGGWILQRTSARTGVGVDEMFDGLVQVIRRARGPAWI
jgi:small GTP-binding protein